MKKKSSTARLHRRSAISRRLAQNLEYHGPEIRVILGEVRKPLKSKGFNNGTAIFQAARQQGCRELPLFGAQWKSWNHSREMPPQLLFLGFGH